MERTTNAKTRKTKKTRFVFKPWVEKTLTAILIFNVMMMLGISDVSSIGAGIAVFGVLIGSSIVIIELLDRYGKEFNKVD